MLVTLHGYTTYLALHKYLAHLNHPVQTLTSMDLRAHIKVYWRCCLALPITECPTFVHGSPEDIQLVAPNCPLRKSECSECDLKTQGEMEPLGMSRFECSECDLKTLEERGPLCPSRCECSECDLKTLGKTESPGMSKCECSECDLRTLGIQVTE